jgi:hypothetical protein
MSRGTAERGDGQPPHGPAPALHASRPSTGRGKDTRTEMGDRRSLADGVRRSGGSDVGCSHAVGCPLFPLLRASLQGWRDYYCDSEGQWRECARHQLALTGERVPISLLPNGARARHLEDVAGAHPSGPAAAGEVAQQAPPSQPVPWSARTASRPRPAADRLPAPFGPVAPTAKAVARSEPAPPPDPVRPVQPSLTARLAESSLRPARHARHAPSPRRGWWTRLADWMRGPA